MAQDRAVTCIVTIHGVGFQQPPLADGSPGYADKLHAALSHEMGPDLLSDDPGRQRSRPGEKGPIYVQSHWPPGQLSTEPGLERLGSWTDDQRRLVDPTGHPLLGERGSIAHVALVYSNAQDLEERPGSALETFAKASVSFHHYATASAVFHEGWNDFVALLPHHAHAPAAPDSSLRVRDVTLSQPVENQDTSGSAPAALQPMPSGPPAIMRQLINDVTTYVCRDELRTRVRSFVHDAILRLCCRSDVGRLVINAHSQGTVLAFDVLRQLPPFAINKVDVLITAGSPLRKYAELFAWGNDAGCIWEIQERSRADQSWLNFWDRTDPVADPLVPPLTWRRGMDMSGFVPGESLFRGINADTGAIIPVAIQDISVDNVANTPPGGLPAHNYWDNVPQFVVPLARLLRQVSTRDAPSSGGMP
ncbi:MAG: hypothetical protein NVS2B16_31980 [Chloroflexota bacterium]